MAIRREVKCIKTKDSPHKHEKITHIGGNWGLNGTRVKITQQQAITDINKDIEYYVKKGSDIADLLVIDPKGKPYLRTTADETKADNLLSLPDCG